MGKENMNGMDVSVLMGANVANEVAQDEFCESTVGFKSKANGEVFQKLFDCPTFRIGTINDVAGVELCGALKNIVALGAGFCHRLGLGGNTKAAIIRIGLKVTAKDVATVLKTKGKEAEFPRFMRIHEIASEG